MGNGTIIVSILLCYGNIEITISTFNLGVALPTYVSHISSRGFEPCSLVLFNSNIKFSSWTGINLSKLDYCVNIRQSSLLCFGYTSKHPIDSKLIDWVRI